MSQYLPFGKEITMTNEQIKQQNHKFDLHETYGIPYDIIDNEYEGEQFAGKLITI